MTKSFRKRFSSCYPALDAGSRNSFSQCRFPSMRTTVSQYAKALLQISQGASESDQKKIAADFFGFLKRKGETKKLARIIRKAEQLEDARSGTQKVSVTTAFPLEEGSERKIEAFAKKVFKAESVTLEKKVDARVLGGFIIKTDNQMLDASIARKMKHVSNLLTK